MFTFLFWCLVCSLACAVGFLLRFIIGFFVFSYKQKYMFELCILFLSLAIGFFTIIFILTPWKELLLQEFFTYRVYYVFLAGMLIFLIIFFKILLPVYIVLYCSYAFIMGGLLKAEYIVPQNIPAITYNPHLGDDTTKTLYIKIKMFTVSKKTLLFFPKYWITPPLVQTFGCDTLQQKKVVVFKNTIERFGKKSIRGKLVKALASLLIIEHDKTKDFCFKIDSERLQKNSTFIRFNKIDNTLFIANNLLTHN